MTVSSATFDYVDMFPTSLQAAVDAVGSQRWSLQNVRIVDPALACDVPLHDMWERGAVPPIGEGTLQTVVRFVHQRHLARADVMVTRMPHESHASDWLEALLTAEGRETLARRELRTPLGHRPDVLFRDGADICRATGIKHNDLLVVLCIRVSQSACKQLALETLVQLAGFVVETDVRAMFAESVVPFEAPRYPVRFAYPESWRVFRLPPRAGCYGLRLLRLWQGGLVGSMQVAVDRTASQRAREGRRHGLPLDQEVRSNMARTGVIWDEGCPTSGTRWMSSGSAFVGTDVSGLRHGRCDSLQHLSGQAVVSSFGPSRAVDPANWAINRRAFEIVRDSLQLAF